MHLTPEARGYAAREILRRAGVSADELGKWLVKVEAQWTTVVAPGSSVCIRFRHTDSPKAGDFRRQTVHAKWPLQPSFRVAQLVPEFPVPWCADRQLDGRPLFEIGPRVVECPFDLPSVVLWALSRVEETQVVERNEHGCFSAHQSQAAQDGFLDRPFVDEYGLALESVLKGVVANWRPAPRVLAVKLSHDMDLVGPPYFPLASYLGTAIGHVVNRRHPMGTLRDLTSLVWHKIEPVSLRAAATLCGWSLARKLESACYWKASPRSDRDSGYDPRLEPVRRAIGRLQEAGVENGIHPGYYTFNSVELLEREVELLASILGTRRIGGRQHYLRWSPETWVHWEWCGLAYDSTLGYNEQPGFRAGTCIPYRPWLFASNRECNLVEIPLVAMDVTFIDYLKLDAAASLELLCDLAEKCKVMGGVFTLLWHNHSVANYPKHTAAYLSLLDKLAGAARFDWQAFGCLPSSSLSENSENGRPLA